MTLLNILVKDADAVQMANHLMTCQECITDRTIVYRQGELRAAIKSGDKSETRYWVVKIDERVGQLHQGSI